MSEIMFMSLARLVVVPWCG